MCTWRLRQAAESDKERRAEELKHANILKQQQREVSKAPSSPVRRLMGWLYHVRRPCQFAVRGLLETTERMPSVRHSCSLWHGQLGARNWKREAC